MAEENWLPFVLVDGEREIPFKILSHEMDTVKKNPELLNELISNLPDGKVNDPIYIGLAALEPSTASIHLTNGSSASASIHPTSATSLASVHDTSYNVSVKPSFTSSASIHPTSATSTPVHASVPKASFYTSAPASAKPSSFTSSTSIHPTSATSTPVHASVPKASFYTSAPASPKPLAKPSSFTCSSSVHPTSATSTLPSAASISATTLSTLNFCKPASTWNYFQSSASSESYTHPHASTSACHPSTTSTTTICLDSTLPAAASTSATTLSTLNSPAPSTSYSVSSFNEERLEWSEGSEAREVNENQAFNEEKQKSIPAPNPPKKKRLFDEYKQCQAENNAEIMNFLVKMHNSNKSLLEKLIDKL
uniref:Uncharacterized protein PB18E9.04c-like n=1 Tax=Saccoglossus kowalevskii TaxID=10224 RepID=A0ABM0MTH4_SACKO|nr:PREDICTED: uncharacterized protein PB18E9.04c-like [Saccoglossus kowalevskii]